MLESDDSAELLRLLPPIRRARGYRLYTEMGGRFLDLWQEDGLGMLGAKGTGLGGAAKAAIDRGLSKPLPSIHERRLEKMLRARYAGYEAARFFDSLDAALAALAALYGDPRALVERDAAKAALLADPARGGIGVALAAQGAPCLVLRPFAAEAGFAAPGGLPAALPIIPATTALSPVALLFRSAADASRVQPSPLPPLRFVAGQRALVELSGYEKTYTERLWRRAERRLSALFERKGPYLYPRGEAKESAKAYRELFCAALARGILLSPEKELPSLIPGEFDDGELAALTKGVGAT